MLNHSPAIDTAALSDGMKSSVYGNMPHWQSSKWSPAIQHRGLSGANSILDVRKKYSNAGLFKNDSRVLSRFRKPVYYDSLHHLKNHFH